ELRTVDLVSHRRGITAVVRQRERSRVEAEVEFSRALVGRYGTCCDVAARISSRPANRGGGCGDGRLDVAAVELSAIELFVKAGVLAERCSGNRQRPEVGAHVAETGARCSYRERSRGVTHHEVGSVALTIDSRC